MNFDIKDDYKNLINDKEQKQPQGTLSLFPKEVFYEVLNHLEKLDSLNLQLVNKEFNYDWKELKGKQEIKKLLKITQNFISLYSEILQNKQEASKENTELSRVVKELENFSDATSNVSHEQNRTVESQLNRLKKQLLDILTSNESSSKELLALKKEIFSDWEMPWGFDLEKEIIQMVELTAKLCSEIEILKEMAPLDLTKALELAKQIPIKITRQDNLFSLYLNEKKFDKAEEVLNDITGDLATSLRKELDEEKAK